jgi:hypothetical protein
MSDTTRDPADEQQIADPHTAAENGGVAPAIDPAGIAQEDPDAPELDDVNPDTDD